MANDIFNGGYDAMGNPTGYPAPSAPETPMEFTRTPRRYPTPDGMDSKSTSDKRIRTLKYPLQGGNDHYVRFYINVNEESRLIKVDKVAHMGATDNSEQNRANRNLSSEQAIKTGAAVVGGVQGAKIASAVSSQKLKQLFGRNVPMSKSYKAAAAGSALGVTAASTAVGAAGGYAVGALASEPFHLTNKLYRLASSITLYTPGNIQSNYSMQYEMPTDLLTDLAQQDQYEAIGKALTGKGDPNRGIASSVARIVASSNSTVSMLSKTAVNPKRDVMFKHVNNRNFEFEYVFAPRSADEAREVADIIYMFKYFAHPEMLPGYGNFLYLYPAEFDIEYGIRDVEGNETINENLNKISSCVLQAVNVNYAPNGSFQSLASGEPVVTTLGLSFMEVEALHQGRIQKGY